MRRANMGAVLTVVGVLLVGVMAGSASADTSVTLAGATLQELLGIGYTAASSFMSTPVSEGKVTGVLNSQCYTNVANNLYAYLYQVENNGITGVNTPIEEFNASVFSGLADSAQMGWLKGTLPSAFDITTGAQMPEAEGFAETTDPSFAAFYYGKRYNKAILPGGHSIIMYVMSDHSPDTTMGYVIDGAVASGVVVGPAVPEPATMALLAFGGVVVFMSRRRRRS